MGDKEKLDATLRMNKDKIKELNKLERKYRWRYFYVLVKVFAPVVFILALIVVFLRFDMPVLTGKTMDGTVVNVRKAQTGYRSISVMNAATIRLDNGDITYVSGVEYKIGDRVGFDMLKTKITGRLKYRHTVMR